MTTVSDDTAQEKQPLQQGQDDSQEPTLQNSNHDHDPNQTGTSLIRHEDETADDDLVSPYQVDPTLVTDAYENPYKETTDNTQNSIRRVPSSDLVPAPFKKFKHIVILAYVGAALFLITGIFAIRLAKSAQMHHSKGLYGLAQRDSRKSAILSYIGIISGTLITIALIIIMANL